MEQTGSGPLECWEGLEPHTAQESGAWVPVWHGTLASLRPLKSRSQPRRLPDSQRELSCWKVWGLSLLRLQSDSLLQLGWAPLAGGAADLPRGGRAWCPRAAEARPWVQRAGRRGGGRQEGAKQRGSKSPWGREEKGDSESEGKEAKQRTEVRQLSPQKARPLRGAAPTEALKVPCPPTTDTAHVWPLVLPVGRPGSNSASAAYHDLG